MRSRMRSRIGSSRDGVLASIRSKHSNNPASLQLLRTCVPTVLPRFRGNAEVVAQSRTILDQARFLILPKVEVDLRLKASMGLFHLVLRGSSCILMTSRQEVVVLRHHSRKKARQKGDRISDPQ